MNAVSILMVSLFATFTGLHSIADAQDLCGTHYLGDIDASSSMAGLALAENMEDAATVDTSYAFCKQENEKKSNLVFSGRFIKDVNQNIQKLTYDQVKSLSDYLAQHPIVKGDTYKPANLGLEDGNGNSINTAEKLKPFVDSSLAIAGLPEDEYDGIVVHIDYENYESHADHEDQDPHVNPKLAIRTKSGTLVPLVNKDKPKSDGRYWQFALKAKTLGKGTHVVKVDAATYPPRAYGCYMAPPCGNAVRTSFRAYTNACTATGDPMVPIVMADVFCAFVQDAPISQVERDLLCALSYTLGFIGSVAALEGMVTSFVGASSLPEAITIMQVGASLYAETAGTAAFATAAAIESALIVALPVVLAVGTAAAVYDAAVTLHDAHYEYAKKNPTRKINITLASNMHWIAYPEMMADLAFRKTAPKNPYVKTELNYFLPNGTLAGTFTYGGF